MRVRISGTRRRLLLAGGGAAVAAAAWILTARRKRSAPEPAFERHFQLLPATGKPRARIFLFGSVKLLSGEDLGAAFAAKGFEVVYLGGVHLIYPSMYRNDGTEFRQLMAQGLNSIMDDLDRQRGSLVNLVAGSSIGGLHAMMAFTLLKPRFAGWLAILPVTKLSALKEFVGIPNPRQFDPFAVADQLRGTKGYMSWGTADDRVDFRLTKALHELVASPGIHHLEYPGLGHETKEFLITDAVRWVDESF